jgi:aldehyde dehydrogenase (NAD+)
MSNERRFYIDGQWVEPAGDATLDVINPATEEPVATIAAGDRRDVDRAVVAARRAFESFARTSPRERSELLAAIIAVYKRRMGDLAAAITAEMGAPAGLSAQMQAPCGLGHLMFTKAALDDFAFEERVASHLIVHEPIGVCGLITPWNWPTNQIGAKVAPALAAGCAVILKPSEVSPLSAIVFAEIMDEAGVPAGVFNLIQGDGPGVGVAMSEHPGIDMISITGSTRAGVSVAEHAAKTVKRVTQELGGKSPNIVLDDADLPAVVGRDTFIMCMNSGQSCNAPSRLLVPKARMAEAAAVAKATAEGLKVGAPEDPATQVGPVASRAQFDKIQGLLQRAVEAGATLECGGPGRPAGLDRGYYVKPTIFSSVDNAMEIAQAEVFGPVLVIIGYDDEDDAVRIANDTEYGLCAYVNSGDPARAAAIGRRLRAGSVYLNGAPVDLGVAFGGYKRSGNGREFGKWGLAEYLETKAMLGYPDGAAQ